MRCLITQLKLRYSALMTMAIFASLVVVKFSVKYLTHLFHVLFENGGGEKVG